MYVKQGVHAHAGHPPDAIERDAELFVWNSLMMVVKGPELAEALEFSNPTQQERPGSMALELLDFHFDLQEGRGGSDSEEADGQVTPPRGLDLRTAMGAGFEPDQTTSIERANCMACVECGRDSTRNRRGYCTECRETRRTLGARSSHRASTASAGCPRLKHGPTTSMRLGSIRA